MLRAWDEMPDEAFIWVLVATRRLDDREQAEVQRLTDEWATGWGASFASCPITLSRILMDGRVLVWAVDDQPRGTDGLTGTELDPLWRPLEHFSAQREPPVEIYPNDALIVDDEIVPMSPYWLELARSRLITEETQILGPCTMADWRSGRFVRRLQDYPELAAKVLGGDDRMV